VLHDNTVGRMLRRLKMTWLQPRLHHPQQDVAAQAAFEKDFAWLAAGVVPAAAAGKPIEIWFQDD